MLIPTMTRMLDPPDYFGARFGGPSTEQSFAAPFLRGQIFSASFLWYEIGSSTSSRHRHRLHQRSEYFPRVRDSDILLCDVHILWGGQGSDLWVRMMTTIKLRYSLYCLLSMTISSLCNLLYIYLSTNMLQSKQKSYFKYDW